jgi:hypothetical protein
MKFALYVVGTSAVGAIALVSVAIAQPPGRGPVGPGGFALLQYDSNIDGRVTRAEFEVAQKARFDSIDANKDGSATSAEFKARREAQADQFRAEALTERFNALDVDKNDQLSRVEFAARPVVGERDGRRNGHGPGRDGHGRYDKGPAKRADANADGTVTLGEFSASGAEVFARADVNKDGAVTITELQSLRPARP